MSVLVSVAVLGLAAILQSTLLPHFAILGVKINLVLLLVTAWSIRRGIESGLQWALIGGVAIDVLSAGPFGSSIVAFGLAAVIAGSVGTGLRQTSILLPFILIPLISIVATLTGAFILQAVGHPISWPVIVATVALPSAVLDTFAILLLYPLVSAADHRLSTVEWPN
jgi:rod shape-determining protein MreD